MRKEGIRPSEERHSVENTVSGIKTLTSNVYQKRSKEALDIKQQLDHSLFTPLRSTEQIVQRSLLNISRRTMIARKLIQTKKNRDCLPHNDIKQIQSFYHNHRISTERPKKLYKGRRLMTMSVRQAYKLFRQEHANTKCSWTKFATRRPKDVILLSPHHLITCKCPY